MPNECPRIDIADKADAAFFFEQVRQHALKMVKHELARHELGKDKEAFMACRQAIDGWVKAAQRGLEPNLNVNGVPFAEGDVESEPFDFHLSKQVQKLREESDKLTEEVVKARKSLPADRARAIQDRFKLMDEKRARIERKRKAMVVEAKEQIQKMAEEEENRSKVTLERADQVEATLESAVRNIEDLSVALLEQSSAAREQSRFVKRLRTMSASYTSL